MKIGLLSPHYAFNYGAVLQAFALKEYLRSIGHDAIILNRRPAYQCAIPSLTGRIARWLEERAKRSSFGRFEKEYLQPQTAPVIFQDDWRRIGLEDFDAIIVGSDQVWRDDYAFTSFDYNFFLDFAEDKIKKIAYAPSLGKGSWKSTADRTKRVKELLNRFDKISVRENSSIKVLKDVFGVEAENVLDPTFLISSAEYTEKFAIVSEEGSYIATYLLDFDDKLKSKIDKLSDDLQLKRRDIVTKSPTSRIGVLGGRFKGMPSVNNWIRNIANAKYVVTNSFHGMVFSIIFRKQFIVVMNEKRGAERFTSLLELFGLEDRLVMESDDRFPDRMKDEINYDLIEEKIQDWVRISKTYLDESLSFGRCE